MDESTSSTPVSTSERTFGQRILHGQDLSVFCHALAVFSPPEELIKLVNYDSFLESVLVLNNAVETALILYKEQLAQRVKLYFGPGSLLARARMIRDYIASLPDGKKSVYFIKVQKETQKLYNYKKPKNPKVKNIPPTPEVKKEISTSEQSFGSMIKNGWDISMAINEIPGYTPGNELIQKDKFALFLESIDAKNKKVEQMYIPYDKAVWDRYQAYEGAAGLRLRMSKIKSYIAGEYGKQSNEYKEAVKIKY